jgi:HEPN domain-containing protein
MRLIKEENFCYTHLMSDQEIILQWREEAREAWIVAKDNLSLGHRSVFLVYAHLALEKALKSTLMLEEKTPPRTHNLFFLAQETTIVWTQDDLTFFQRVSPYAVEARYDSGSLFMQEAISRENIDRLTTTIPTLLFRLSISFL